MNGKTYLKEGMTGKNFLNILHRLHRDFTLGYFDNNVSTAQKKYHEFVNSLVNEEYDSPLDEVVSSTLLGSPDFITFIKNKYLSVQKPDKNLPALNELTQKASLQDIVEEVDSVFSKEASLARNVKIYLCQRYTGKKGGTNHEKL